MDQCLGLGSTELPTVPQAVRARIRHGHTAPSSKAVVLSPHARVCPAEGGSEVLSAPSRTPRLPLGWQPQCGRGRFVSKYPCCKPRAVRAQTSSSPCMRTHKTLVLNVCHSSDRPKAALGRTCCCHKVMEVQRRETQRARYVMRTAMDHVAVISRISYQQIKSWHSGPFAGFSSSHNIPGAERPEKYSMTASSFVP